MGSVGFAFGSRSVRVWFDSGSVWSGSGQVLVWWFGLVPFRLVSSAGFTGFPF